MYVDISNEKVEGKKLVVENFNSYYEKSGSKRKKYIKYEIYPQITNQSYEDFMYGMYKVYTHYKKTTITESEYLENTKTEGAMVYLPHVLVNQEQVICTILSDGFHNDVVFFITKSAKESLKRQAKYLYDHIDFYKLCNCQSVRRMSIKPEFAYSGNDLYIAVSERTDEMPEYKQEEKTEETKMLNDNHSQLEKFITKDKKDIDISDVKDILKNKKEEAEPEEEKKDYSELEVFITKEKTEDKKMLNDNHSQLEKFITKDKKDIDISDIEDIFKNKKEEKTEVLPPEEQKDYSSLESFVTKDKKDIDISDIDDIFKDKDAEKRYFITSRRHQKPGDEHIPSEITKVGVYTRTLVLEEDGSYELYIRHADTSTEGQAVILDEDGANKDILKHKDFIFMIDDDFPAELYAIKQIKEKEVVNQPEEKTSLDDIINKREKVRTLPIFIFKNTEKRENIERIHDVIKNNPLGYTIILDKDDVGFAILDRECDGTYRKINIKDLDRLNNFIEVHQGYDFYINEKTYEKLNKDALDKKQLVLF